MGDFNIERKRRRGKSFCEKRTYKASPVFFRYYLMGKDFIDRQTSYCIGLLELILDLLKKNGTMF